MGSKLKRGLERMTHYAFTFQAWADTAHAYPLWMAAYKKVLGEIANNENTWNEFGFQKAPFRDVKKELPGDDFYKNPTEDKVLPSLNADDLTMIGKENKPVVLKKNIAELNDKKHSDIRGEESRIIEEALYNADLILQSKKSSKPNYFCFIKFGKDNSTTVIELSGDKENFEIVHYYKVDKEELGRLIKRTGQEDGQFLITKRITPQWAADLSALLPGNENIQNFSDFIEKTSRPCHRQGVARRRRAISSKIEK
jgi:hypothetical protein